MSYTEAEKNSLQSIQNVLNEHVEIFCDEVEEPVVMDWVAVISVHSLTSENSQLALIGRDGQLSHIRAGLLHDALYNMHE